MKSRNRRRLAISGIPAPRKTTPRPILAPTSPLLATPIVTSLRPNAQSPHSLVAGRSLRVNASAGLTNVILRGLRRIGAPDVLAAAEEPSRSFFGAEGSAPELADHLPVAENPAPGCVRQPVRHGGFR